VASTTGETPLYEKMDHPCQSVYKKGMTKSDIAKLIKGAEAYCKERGIRFTEPRRFVLEIIAGAKKPMSAYEILAALGEFIPHPKPPTAYRAIEFLMAEGFVHKIESVNGYVVCSTDHRHAGSQFLVCDSCGKVIEAHLCKLPQDLAKAASKQKFALTRWNAELHGTCAECV
jgi:Fur family zinc uptake transcriptional regulator